MFNKLPKKESKDKWNEWNQYTPPALFSHLHPTTALLQVTKKPNIEFSQRFREIYKKDWIKQEVGKEKLATHLGKEMEKLKRQGNYTETIQINETKFFKNVSVYFATHKNNSFWMKTSII